jgi:hypothetical protein
VEAGPRSRANECGSPGAGETQRRHYSAEKRAYYLRRLVWRWCWQVALFQ